MYVIGGRLLVHCTEVSPLLTFSLSSAHGSLKTVELLMASTRVDLSPLTPDKETLLILASARVS